MRLAALGFALGVWLLQQQPALPGVSPLAAVAASACAALAAAWFSRRFSAAAAALAIVAFAGLGFSWAAALAHLRLSDRLDAALEGRDVEVTGVVASLPQIAERAQRFDFDVESPASGVPRHISLSLYDAPAPAEAEAIRVHAGERWRFSVRLRRPHGAANPHGFDYEAWLLERGIRATGYVRPKHAQERLAEFVPTPGYWIERLREAARDKIHAALPERPATHPASQS